MLYFSFSPLLLTFLLKITSIKVSAQDTYLKKLDPQLIYSSSSEYNPTKECNDEENKLRPICELLPPNYLKIAGTYFCSELTYKEVKYNDMVTKNYTAMGKADNYTDVTFINFYEFSAREIKAVLNGTDKYISRYIDWLLVSEEVRKREINEIEKYTEDEEVENSDTKSREDDKDHNQTDTVESTDSSSSPIQNKIEFGPRYKKVTITEAREYLTACENVCIEGLNTGGRFSKYEEVRFID